MICVVVLDLQGREEPECPSDVDVQDRSHHNTTSQEKAGELRY